MAERSATTPLIRLTVSSPPLPRTVAGVAAVVAFTRTLSAITSLP
jgi:hypothetical protein